MGRRYENECDQEMDWTNWRANFCWVCHSSYHTRNVTNYVHVNLISTTPSNKMPMTAVYLL